MKYNKTLCFLVFGAITASPANATENWLQNLYSCLSYSDANAKSVKIKGFISVSFGGGLSGSDTGVESLNVRGPIYVPQGPGGGGDPGVDPVNASGPIYIPQGPGGGGDPGVDPN